MKREKVEFDMSYLRSIVDERLGREQLAAGLGVGEGRLAKLLFGKRAFSFGEMMSCTVLLGLDRDEFERCFFRPESSEILNFDKDKYEVRE